MELICPKCDARYQIPDGSIGSAGRQVSCMSCSHAWHAYPPLVLDTQAAPREPAVQPMRQSAPEQAPPSETPAVGGGLLASDWDTDPPSGGAPPQANSGDGDGGGGLLSSDYESDPPGYMRQRHVPDDEPSGPVMHGGPVGGRTRGGQALKLHDSNDAGGAPPAPPPEAPPAQQPAAAPAAMSGAERLEKSRSDQMAEIRAMLADVQASERPEAAPAPEQTKAAPAASRVEPEPAAPRLAASQVMEEYHQSAVEQEENDADDPLRKRLMSTAMKSATSETDVKKLRKKHEKKERKRKHQKAAGSGAFLTGFLFIVMIAAGMAAMYLLAPQIVERAPETSNAMAQYVATVDTLKAQVIEFFDGMSSWVIERADPERAKDN